jgi:aldehyde:ferredoxin oxidoreductase
MHNPDLLVPGPGDEILSRRGKAVDRASFETMKDEYYELRGWDRETGFIKRDTLNKLGLEGLIDPLGDKAVG